MRVMPKGQRVQLKRETSSDRVLEVAAKLFREKGYQATSVREIALAAQMKSGSLYYHYPSKEALLDAVMNLAITKLTDEVAAAIRQTPPSAAFRARLKNAIHAHLTAIHQHIDLVIASRQSLNTLPQDSRAAHLTLRERYAQLWRNLLEDGKRSGEVAPGVDVVVVEMFILGALNWTSEWLDPGRTSFERLSESLMQLVLDGAGAASTAPMGSHSVSGPHARQATNPTTAGRRRVKSS